MLWSSYAFHPWEWLKGTRDVDMYVAQVSGLSISVIYTPKGARQYDGLTGRTSVASVTMSVQLLNSLA